MKICTGVKCPNSHFGLCLDCSWYKELPDKDYNKIRDKIDVGHQLKIIENSLTEIRQILLREVTNEADKRKNKTEH